MNNQNKKGLFIVIEGPDGSGKSTLAKKLAEHLRSLPEFANREIINTRSPGTTLYGEEIRKVFLRNDIDEPISPAVEEKLMEADRIQLIEQVIIPAVNRGAIVIADRYYFTSYVYQYYWPKISKMEMPTWTEYATSRGLADYPIHPDLCFVLNVPFRTLQERIAARPMDRSDSRGDLFLRASTNAYLRLTELWEDEYNTAGRIVPNLDIYGIDNATGLPMLTGTIVGKLNYKETGSLTPNALP